MSNLLECRYNKNHKMKLNKLYTHEEKCPDRIKIDLVQCQYDFSHKIKKSDLINHYKNCKSKPRLNEETQREILYFLQKQSPSKNSSIKKKSKIEQNLPIGMNYLRKNSDIKKFNKEIIECFDNLENRDNNENILPYCGINFDADENFQERVDRFDNNNGEFSFNLENKNFENNDINPNKSKFIKKEKFKKTFAKEYDPNESIIYFNDIKNNQSFD